MGINPNLGSRMRLPVAADAIRDVGQGTLQRVDLMHAATGTTLYVAVYWVTHAASMTFLIAGLLVLPYYIVRPICRLLRRHRST